jgi:hypothetical protein
VRGPGRLPVVGGDEDLMFGVDDEGFVVAHDVGNAEKRDVIQSCRVERHANDVGKGDIQGYDRERDIAG